MIILGLTVSLLAAALALNKAKPVVNFVYIAVSQLALLLVFAPLAQSTLRQAAFIYLLAVLLGLTGVLAVIILGKNNHSSSALKLSFLLCTFSLIGFPPFLGFWPKLWLILELTNRSYVSAVFLAVLSYSLGIFYMLKLYSAIFPDNRESGHSAILQPLEYSALLPAIACLGLGFGINMLIRLLR